MRKVLLTILVGVLSSSMSFAGVGLSFGLSNSNLTGSSSTVPIIGVPIELNKNLIIQPNLMFYSLGQVNDLIVSKSTNIGIGSDVIFRLSNAETHPIVGGGFSFVSATSEAEVNGNDVETSQTRFGLSGIFGIEHNVSNDFTIALQGTLGFSSYGDTEVNNVKAIDGYTNFGLGIQAVLRMFLN
jgi:outer membrane protein with beta-barrel domain